MERFRRDFFDFAQSVTPGSRLRLAPTPSGFLHLGNALNFIFTWLVARQGKAKIFLRIDDLDNDRNRPAYLEDIFETLDWLQLDWDEEPKLQSEQLSRYLDVLHALRTKNLLFACQKSRKDLEPFGGNYPLEFRDQNLSLDTPDAAWRIKTIPGFPLPDFVVRRRDGIPSYQIASYSDELFYGMSHIIRGVDLSDSTLAQSYLAQVLDTPKFLNINFLHHPLLLNEQGEKLSKSADSRSLKSMREAGLSPEQVFLKAGQWLGLAGDSAQRLLKSLTKELG